MNECYLTLNNVLSNSPCIFPFQGRTTLIVAHRLSTAAQCDQIAVIEDGRVVEIGEILVLNDSTAWP